VTQDLDDPFALPAVSKVDARDGIITGGRYRLPQRDGTHKKGGWQRVSNLVSAYSDQYALRLWEIGEVLQGVGLDPALMDQVVLAQLHLLTKAERRAWVEGFIEHAKDASGGNAAAKHGTQRHASVETLHAGLPYGHLDAGTRRHLALYQQALVRHGLTALPGMQERRVLVEELGAVGTLDNILTDAVRGYDVVADLKTQRRFWTWLEIKAQQACYNHAVAMWDEASGTWVDMPPVSLEVALILWMPRKPDDPVEAQGWEPHVDVWEVDTVAGWETAKRAYQVVLDRAKGKSVNPGAWLRPAPEPTELERYAALFAAVDSIPEGRALVQECRDKGIWCDILRDAAQAAYDRVAVPA
jgi:hypothetical protein